MPKSANIKVRLRCAAHNHVFEVYGRYEAIDGELVFDLVPCPFCYSQKEMVSKPICSHPPKSRLVLQKLFCEDYGEEI